MRVAKAKLILVGVCAALIAVSASAVSADDGAIERGNELAERLCSDCHATGPTGESAFAEAPPFRDIARRYNVDDLAEAFAEGIVVGHPAMPVFEFSPPVIGDLLAYLHSLE